MSDTSEFIKTIKLENFKGFRKIHEFDLDADLILITGKNGVGKTSLLEALDWSLNHTEESAGNYLTLDETDGGVCINDKQYKLQGKGSIDHKSIESVSSFFYQENIKELACSDVIQLLEPENNQADEIRQELKKIQSQLEIWQRKIQQLKYSKNYGEERKRLANQVNVLVDQLPNETRIKKMLKDSTLTLKNGNLQSKWESQIRNLSKAVTEISNLSEPVGAKLPQQLRNIGENLKEYRSSNSEDVSISIDKGFLSSVNQLPEMLKISRSDPGASVDLSNYLYITTKGHVYSEAIGKLELEQENLRSEYHNLSGKLEDTSGEGASLKNWLNAFKDNIDIWLRAWEKHPDEATLIELKGKLGKNISTFRDFSEKRFRELSEQIKVIENRGQELASKINYLKRAQTVALEIDRHSSELEPLLSKNEFSVGELVGFLSNIVHPKQSSSSTIDEASLLNNLGTIFENWAQLELEKMNDESQMLNSENIDAAEAIIQGATAICKQEAGARSQLLSLIGEIPKNELKLLIENMNSLLANFHFPKDFLPIEIKNFGTQKKPSWGFKTKSNIKFDDLSTGQKSQLAICWTINLNLALSNKLGHRVIGFDDFTTSLDMNQLIPAAILLRKLAYTDDEDSKRQVIVTSHHEDLTNRLLDFLLPPNGSKMKVIQFEDWNPNSGPKYSFYTVDMGEKVEIDGLESAIQHIVASK
ncbi:MAG: AAA family ATPase [gamma proteobacterium symbiont of Ctena orbiculata]|uniref:Recombination protein F n=2 Tax=Candidatus Thiodiazotropha endolucinida TaxID=1655433 RepID=A0A7Z0VJH5_9GAMM|nr:recombination protein F [Candidatus Thiodiazotropha endolucinida]